MQLRVLPPSDNQGNEIQKLVDIWNRGFSSSSFALQKDSGCHRTMVPMASCSHFVHLMCVSLTDAHILSCSFTVKTRSIRTEATPQCSVDGVPLRPYDSDNTRKEGNAPKECADLFPKLKDIEEELRNQIHTIEEKGYLTTGKYKTGCKDRRC